MQRAIDRAFLIQRYGEVWKHARLKADQYAETEFLAEYPREGGIILDAYREHAGPFIDRVASAIRPVFEQALERGLEQHANLDAQMSDRREYVRGMQDRTPAYEAVAAEPPPSWASAHSNRSVVKEIDQLVSQVTPVRVEGSTVEIGLAGDTQHLPFLWPLVVSCGTQQSELVFVVEPGGHVGRLHLSLSTCPRGGCQEHGIERWD